jgi:hypothetical protein
MIDNIQIGSTYNFFLRAPAILGAEYKNAVVMGILDFDSANVIQDVAPLHASVYSSLPVGTPKDAKDLLFVKIRTSTGEVRVIAKDWLSMEPVLVVNKNVRIDIINVDLSRLPILRAALEQNGFTSFTISTN